MFFICSLAETNRTPFDLPEAEAELVAGYNVDYSSLPFALFFLGEYSNMLLMSSLNVLLFWGGWYLLPFYTNLNFMNNFFFVLVFGLKVSVLAGVFVLIRAILPRYRYDQLMFLQWKIFLPFVLLFIMLLLVLRILF
jgi:NADH-quinone oxidoreductase subunit H